MCIPVRPLVLFALTSLLFTSACGGLEHETAPIIDETASAISTPQARPCRSDSIFIDVPMQKTPSWSHLGFLPGLAASLTVTANHAPPGQVPRAWFCGAGQVTCPSNDAVVTVTPVLAPRSTPAWRADGHLRFFRVKFHDSVTGAPLELREGSRCEAVASVRAQFSFHAGASAGDVFVGRECDGSAQTVEAAATDEMVSWHLSRMGLPASAVDLAPRPRTLQTVDLATVDTGVDPAVAASADLDLATNADLIGQPVLHAHGTAMTVLQRQLAPAATLHSYRAMSKGGSGVSAELARGIDEALFAPASNSRPLVINLSLGWPSELSQPARLADLDCSTHEDPFGEIVRYELDVARRLDDSGTRPVFVVAAVGNQPLRDVSTFPAPPVGMVAPACNPSALNESPWFMPAAWQHIDTCRVAAETSKVAFGVSAVDDREAMAGNAIRVQEAPLVAPGQHVYATHDAATPAIGGAMCSLGGEKDPPVRLPAALSGSSVSAALVSGAAARAQSLRFDARLPALTWDGLARMLYVSGRGLCRKTGRLEVRRLDVARLDRAVTDRACQPLVACVEALPGTATIPNTIMSACMNEIVACGLEQSNGRSLVPSCPDVPTTSVPWPTGYADSLASCGNPIAGDVMDVETDCGAGLCPYETKPNRTLLGTLGPQPNAGGCLDCSLSINSITGAVTLVAEINPSLPAGSGMTSPYVVITGKSSSGQSVAKYVPIDQQGQAWKPAQAYKVTFSIAGVDLVWSTAGSSLISTLSTPGSPAGQDVSPLRTTVTSF